MAGAPPQQNSQDSGMGPLWVSAAVILAGWITWYYFHEQITAEILKLKLYEAIGISYFDDSIQPLILWIQSIPPESYGKISSEQLIDISEGIGRYFRFPIMVFCAVVSAYVYKRSPSFQFRRTYSMQLLVKEEEQDWPQISPVVKLDLVHTKLDEGPWSSAMTPMQFVKRYKLFKETPIETSEPVLSHKEKSYASLYPDQAYRVLSMQLGKLWLGIDDLPIYVQALFAAFAARAAKDTQTAMDFLIQISRSSASGKLDFSGTKALLKKHRDKKEVQKIYHSHAYMLTVMASMLHLAREDGVLASADFLWLKPLDRSLWYMLNAVGRQTSYIEVAGVFAHWKAELEFGRPIIVPMVGEAVKALDAALKEILYVPDNNE